MVSGMTEKKKTLLNYIRDLFAESCAEMFLSLNCEIAHSGLVDEVIEGSPTSVIDAGSEEIELFLIMRMPYSVLALTYPITDRDINDVLEEQLDDWLAELSNLLMGRIKAKMIKHHCHVMLGLPAAYFGNEIDITEVNKDFDRLDFPFEVDHELCECVLDIKIFNENLDFSQQVDEEVDVMAEGDIELF